jgi:hypothetical protein
MATVTQNKRTSESKYVTIFNDGSDGTTDVDISFREPLLNRPSDHFLVGVDNLTVNLTHLSMIEPNDPTKSDDFVFQVGRLSGRTNLTVAGLEAQVLLGVGADELLYNLTPYITPEKYKYRITTAIQNIQQLVADINAFFEYVNYSFITEGVEEALAIGGRNNANHNDVLRKIQPRLLETERASPDSAIQVQAFLTASGNLRIRGTRLFWATHFIRILDPKAMCQQQAWLLQTPNRSGGGGSRAIHWASRRSHSRSQGTMYFLPLYPPQTTEYSCTRLRMGSSARCQPCPLAGTLRLQLQQQIPLTCSNRL